MNKTSLINQETFFSQLIITVIFKLTLRTKTTAKHIILWTRLRYNWNSHIQRNISCSLLLWSWHHISTRKNLHYYIKLVPLNKLQFMQTFVNIYLLTHINHKRRVQIVFCHYSVYNPTSSKSRNMLSTSSRHWFPNSYLFQRLISVTFRN